MELRTCHLKKVGYFIGVIFSLALVGCGGGGGGGGSSVSASTISTARATVTPENSEEISQGAYEAARLASGYSNAPVQFRAAADGERVNINNVIYDAKQSMTDSLSLSYSSTLARVEQTDFCIGGGSTTIIFPDLDANATSVPQNGSGEFIFDNCREDGFLFDGTIDFVWNGFSNSLGFENYTVTFDLTVTELSSGRVETISGTGSCTDFGNDCSFSEEFSGADGTDYRIEDVVVTGDSLNGYNMTARVFHETYGFVDIVATGITYCPTGNIATGNILATDSTGAAVLDVTFTSCNDCIVTFDGVQTIIPQP